MAAGSVIDRRSCITAEPVKGFELAASKIVLDGGVGKMLRWPEQTCATSHTRRWLGRASPCST